MSRSKVKVGLTIATLVAAGGVVSGVSGAGAAGAADDREHRSVVSSKVTTAAAAAKVRQYWTPRRMANAKPYDVSPDPAARGSSRGATATATRGAPVTVPGSTGEIGTNSLVPRVATPLVRPYTDLPDRLNAKVFFTTTAGGNAVCSGTIVNSVSKRMVSTAGHCVSDGKGNYFRNVLVVPAYASSCNTCTDAPYGRWTSRQQTVRIEWHQFENFKQDMGYIITNDLNGRRIVDVIGGQGAAFNLPRNQGFQSFGYPAEPPFSGFNQNFCPSGYLGDDNPNPARPGPLTMRISCNMTGGSSGGGWLINATGGIGRINSVNSYGYGGAPNDMYGPYFGNEALSLYRYTEGLG